MVCNLRGTLTGALNCRLSSRYACATIVSESIAEGCVIKCAKVNKIFTIIRGETPWNQSFCVES